MEHCQQSESLINLRDRVGKFSIDEKSLSDSLRSEDFRISVDHPKLNKEDSLETRNLKELVLLKIDLIQQLQELVMKRDSENAALHQENQRLLFELAQLKQFPALREKESVENNSCMIRKKKRKSSGERLISKTARLVHDDTGSKQECLDDSTLPSIEKAQLKDVDAQTLSRGTSRDGKKHPGSEIWVKSNPATAETSWKARLKQLMTAQQSQNVKDDVMRTATPYYVRSSSAEGCDQRVLRSSESQYATVKEEVTVPCWRVHLIPTGYQMEGTENLTDEIYLSRHDKPEADEKRRKRWDLQRLRELKHYHDKLHQQEASETAVNKDAALALSLSVDIDNLQYIEVCELLPVQAFGCPVPAMEKSDFSLPWSVSASYRQQLLKEDKSQRHKKK